MSNKNGVYIKNFDSFNRQLKGIATRVRNLASKDAVEAGIRVIEGNAVVNITENFSSKQTGIMAKDRTVEVKNSGGEATGTLTFNSNHARVQELGGTIKPVNGSFLAIPLTSAAKKHASPKEYPDELHFVGTNAGGVLMNDADEPIYAMKTSVTLPPRPFLRPAMDEHKSEIKAAMAAVINDAIREEAGG